MNLAARQPTENKRLSLTIKEFQNILRKNSTLKVYLTHNKTKISSLPQDGKEDLSLPLKQNKERTIICL